MTLAAKARRVVEANLYMTLATADAAGVPWASPVYFTPHEDREYYWVSSPEARHSRNIAVRPTIAIAIFDSQVPIGGAEAVYITAEATEVSDLDALAIYNSRLPTEKHFTREELVAPAPFRLYRATATDHSILIRGGDPDHNTPADSRLPVNLRQP